MEFTKIKNQIKDAQEKVEEWNKNYQEIAVKIEEIKHTYVLPTENKEETELEKEELDEEKIQANKDMQILLEQCQGINRNFHYLKLYYEFINQLYNDQKEHLEKSIKEKEEMIEQIKESDIKNFLLSSKNKEAEILNNDKIINSYLREELSVLYKYVSLINSQYYQYTVLKNRYLT